MGVDFETCDTCGETPCDQNIKYLHLALYGEYATCTVCFKKYFTTEWSIEKQRYILSEENHGYTFFVADTTDKTDDYEYTNKNAIFISESFHEIEEYAERHPNVRFGMI